MSDTQTNMKAEADLRLVLVVGQSGAGHSTALRVLEDAGFKTVDNLPLALVDQLIAIEVETAGRRLAIGIDLRTTGFDAGGLASLRDNLHASFGSAAQLVFVEAEHNELIRRFQSTRRQHPLCLTLDLSLAEALQADREQMASVRSIADIVMDSTGRSPASFREEMLARLGLPAERPVPLVLVSFSYRNGLPEGADFVFDMRFLGNPHWQEALRPLTGMDAQVLDFISADPAFGPFTEQLTSILGVIVPRLKNEGRPQLTLAFGCSGGRHRSVAATEWIASWAAENEIDFIVRHRELLPD